MLRLPIEVQMAHVITAQVLAILLQQAVDSAVIIDRYRGYQIRPTEYRSLLMSSRQSFDQSVFAGQFRLDIQDGAVREQLVTVIRAVLGQYIQDDRLLSAILVTGGPLGGFHIDELIEHLLTIALVRGSAYAANDLFECAGKVSVEMQFVGGRWFLFRVVSEQPGWQQLSGEGGFRSSDALGNCCLVFGVW